MEARQVFGTLGLAITIIALEFYYLLFSLSFEQQLLSAIFDLSLTTFFAFFNIILSLVIVITIIYTPNDKLEKTESILNVIILIIVLVLLLQIYTFLAILNL